MLELISSPSAMQTLSDSVRMSGKKIGFVPTMGCLHNGHLSLLNAARQQSDVVIASIFVNPLQFGPNEDFKSYPRTLERDLELCKTAGVNAVFCPKAEEIYSSNFNTKVFGGPLTKLYCGNSRPQFFDGVLTVVSILFNLVKPHAAFFGEKDYQQLFLIKQMVRDLRLPIDIVGMPIIREPNGLAMSSRNEYLTPHERHLATCLHRALNVSPFFKGGRGILQSAQEILNSVPEFVTDYCVLVDTKTLLPIPEIPLPPFPKGESYRLLIAGYFGEKRVRLIDNGEVF